MYPHNRPRAKLAKNAKAHETRRAQRQSAPAPDPGGRPSPSYARASMSRNTKAAKPYSYTVRPDRTWVVLSCEHQSYVVCRKWSNDECDGRVQYGVSRLPERLHVWSFREEAVQSTKRRAQRGLTPPEGGDLRSDVGKPGTPCERASGGSAPRPQRAAGSEVACCMAAKSIELTNHPCGACQPPPAAQAMAAGQQQVHNHSSYVFKFNRGAIGASSRGPKLWALAPSIQRQP